MSTHSPSMPRHSSLSVARFYDWSEQDAADKEDIVSVSRLYREMAKGPKASSLARSQSERVRSWPAGGQWLGPPGSKTRMNPGRMFLRDKGVLTKGEREIIEGIYKNRGDLRRDQSGTKSDYVVRSHQDAWLVGKHYRLHKPSSEIPRLPAPSEEDPQDTRITLASQGTGTPEAEDHRAVTCILCLKEQQQQQQPLPQKHRRSVTSPRMNSVPHPVPMKVLDTSQRSQEPAAPPSSPDGISSASFVMPSSATTPVHSHVKEKPVTLPSDHPEDSSLPGADDKTSGRTGSGTPWQEEEEEAEEARNLSERFNPSEGPNNSHTSPDPDNPTKRGFHEGPEMCCSSPSQDSDDSRRRLHVYLPKIAPEPTEDELKACLLQGRPVLARERPLSHRDLKRGQLRLGRPGQKPPVLSDTPQPARERDPVKTSSQYHRTGKKMLALNGETFVENCGSQSPSANTNTISFLSSEMEHWQLLDE